MTEFTPITGLAGGILIGLSALVLMAGNGRILGASGFFNGLLTTTFGEEFKWRAVLVAGMLLGAALSAGLGWFDPASIAYGGSTATLIIGGLLVGAGTTLGSGCTSGHGICGIARLSPRSIVATCVFMAAAIVVVFVTRHLGGA
jgi:uncharacterized protein